MNTLDSVVRAIGQQLKAKNEELPARITGVFSLHNTRVS